MHYTIDGYNLLFRLLFSSRPLQEIREKVIHDLNQKFELLHIDATVVFDASFHLEGGERFHIHNLEIVYTQPHESADDYILNSLKNISHPRQEIVVTSDKGLAWRSRRLGAKTESVEEFIGWLNERYKNRIKKGRREKKETVKKETKTPTTPTKNIPHVKEAKPGKTAHESFDYYLETFEKEAHETENQSDKIKPTEKKQELSDFERWKKHFEEGSQE